MNCIPGLNYSYLPVLNNRIAKTGKKPKAIIPVHLYGMPAKAHTLLGWNPTKTSFPELVKIMVQHDTRFVRKLKLKAGIDESINNKD